MPHTKTQRVIVAKSPEGKVTTINILLGEKGVPWGWEYIVTEKGALPPDNQLKDSWPELIKGKRIHVSTLNYERTTLPSEKKEINRVVEHQRELNNHRGRIFHELDIKFLRTYEKPFQNRQRQAIIRYKEALRSVNTRPDSFECTEEYLKYWPTVFDTTIDDYKEEPILLYILLLTIIVASGLWILFL